MSLIFPHDKLRLFNHLSLSSTFTSLRYHPSQTLPHYYCFCYSTYHCYLIHICLCIIYLLLEEPSWGKRLSASCSLLQPQNREGAEAQYSSYQSHVNNEHLKWDQSELSCVIRLKYIPDFKDLLQKKNVK